LTSRLTERYVAPSEGGPAAGGHNAAVATADPDALSREYAAILDHARASVRAGREPNWSALEERLRAIRKQPRTATAAGEVEAAERRALQQLKRVISVHRARALLAPAAPAPRRGPASPGRRAALLRMRPTHTGNMEVIRERDGDAFVLRWDGTPAIAEWEVRISERPDARGEYEVLQELTLPPTGTRVELPLGELPMKVHILGRTRDGRLLRRAVIAALTQDGWGERWQRRASAS
jgi:hypothetical protein